MKFSNRKMEEMLEFIREIEDMKFLMDNNDFHEAYNIYRRYHESIELFDEGLANNIYEINDLTLLLMFLEESDLLDGDLVCLEELIYKKEAEGKISKFMRDELLNEADSSGYTHLIWTDS